LVDSDAAGAPNIRKFSAAQSPIPWVSPILPILRAGFFGRPLFSGCPLFSRGCPLFAPDFVGVPYLPVDARPRSRASIFRGAQIVVSIETAKFLSGSRLLPVPLRTFRRKLVADRAEFGGRLRLGDDFPGQQLYPA